MGYIAKSGFYRSKKQKQTKEARTKKGIGKSSTLFFFQSLISRDLYHLPIYIIYALLSSMYPCICVVVNPYSYISYMGTHNGTEFISCRQSNPEQVSSIIYSLNLSRKTSLLKNQFVRLFRNIFFVLFLVLFMSTQGTATTQPLLSQFDYLLCRLLSFFDYSYFYFLDMEFLYYLFLVILYKQLTPSYPSPTYFLFIFLINENRHVIISPNILTLEFFFFQVIVYCLHPPDTIIMTKKNLIY